MASRSGAGSNGFRQSRPRDNQDEYPPLPRSAPRLPPLRNLNADRGRAGSRPSSPPVSASFNSLATSSRPASRYWSAAARRAERIRNIDDRAPTLDDLESNAMDHSWLSSSRRAMHVRPSDSPSFQNGRPPDLDELDQSLDEANAQLRSLLDMTSQVHLMTPLLQSTLSPTIRSHDFPDENVRSKRRKIDSNRLVPSSRGFRYGKYGQIEPGRLRMEIVSCDGGMFSNELSYAADNILKNDTSVYCTKGNRCNIVLRHQGAAVFALEELIVKAPAAMNYSHPVREGMVFITMDQDDILSRTAQYQIQYKHPPPNTQSDDTTSFRPPSERDATPRHIVSIRHHNDGTTSTRVRRSHSYSQHPDPDLYDERVPEMPSEFVSNQPHFHVTTECTSDEDDVFEISHTLRRPPDRIGSLPFETETSDSEVDTGNPFSTSDSTESLHRQPPASPRQSHYHAYESARERDIFSISLSEAWDAHNSATQDAIRAVGGGLLVPHAKFYIEKKKSKCTIRFNPPVSGRFILLKMWSSRHDAASNIDVQTVMAKGYAGPRYFPSVHLS
ncbi:hypothetical protein E4U42_000227 [Claviceps africana]|uniref:Eukaryotic translation initiation factor 6 n=1 Tax=Claviceps africana TaxID=83212 RepID=A0A8K0NER8_9HYPO|nr:hypothetical protein E4U42_000227 [Claviceps africana]